MYVSPVTLCLQKRWRFVFIKGIYSATLGPALYDFFFNYINKRKCFHFCFSLIQFKTQQYKICDHSPTMLLAQMLPCGFSKCTRSKKWTNSKQTWNKMKSKIIFCIKLLWSAWKVNKHSNVKRKVDLKIVYLLALWQQSQWNISVKCNGETFVLLKANGRTPTDFSGVRICNQVALSLHSYTKIALLCHLHQSIFMQLALNIKILICLISPDEYVVWISKIF